MSPPHEASRGRVAIEHSMDRWPVQSRGGALVSAASQYPLMRRLPMNAARWTTIVAIAMLAAGCASRSAPAPTAGVPMAALAPALPQVPVADYRIQAGDELHVRFPYQQEVSEQVPVRPDGRVSLAT